MNTQEWKLRMAVLWIIMFLSLLSLLVFNMLDIVLSESVREEKLGQGDLVLVSAVFLFEIIMVWLSLVLKPTISRWPGFVLIALCLISIIPSIFESLTSLTWWSIILHIWALAASILIIWNGIKIPKNLEG